MSTRKRWEYDTRQVGSGADLFLDDDDMEMLREMGAAGWEFVQFVRSDMGWQLALFKREVIDV